MRMRISDTIAANLPRWITDILDRCGYGLLFRSAGFVPEGHLKIARRFNAGMASRASQVPKGRLNSINHFSRPFGNSDGVAGYPALKRRAILECPYGIRIF
jgi:hypothetical protein